MMAEHVAGGVDDTLMAMALPSGSRFGQFKIHSLLGAGSFGITYRALDLRLRRQVAIKEYCPRKFARRDADRHTVQPRTERYAKVFHGGLRLFLNEARLLARFSHPAVVRVTQLFESNNTAYIVMELERGASLQAVLPGNRRMNTLRVNEVFLPLLEGLREIHEQSVLHCDISPNNIVLRDDGSAVLIDFGAARAAWDSDLAVAGSSMFTRAYAAPEVRFGKLPTGPWSDIYGLGAVMFRCLTGESPLPAEGRRPLPGAPLDGIDPVAQMLAPLRDSPPQALAESVRWMLEPHPARRPQCVADVVEALHCADTDAVRTLARRRRPRAPATRTSPAPRLAPVTRTTQSQASVDCIALLARRLAGAVEPATAAQIAKIAAVNLGDEQVLDCVTALRSGVAECGALTSAARASSDGTNCAGGHSDAAVRDALMALAGAGRAIGPTTGPGT